MIFLRGALTSVHGVRDVDALAGNGGGVGVVRNLQNQASVEEQPQLFAAANRDVLVALEHKARANRRCEAAKS